MPQPGESAELKASSGASKLKKLADSSVLGILGRRGYHSQYAFVYRDSNAIQMGQTHAVRTVLCAFSCSIGLPVFPTGAIVVLCTREDVISLDPGMSGLGRHYRPVFHKVFN